MVESAGNASVTMWSRAGVSGRIGGVSCRFRVLGPVEVWAGERQLPLGGRRQLALLALLLLEANRPVSADALVDAIWGAERDGAAKRLQMAVMRLRRALMPLDPSDGPRLRTLPGGYRLSVGAGELDAEVFAGRVADGRRLLEQGDSRLVYDLSGLTFCDSTGLTVFVRAKNRIDELGGRLSLAAPSPIVHRVLDVSGLLQVLDTQPSVADAVAAAARTE